MALRVLHLSTYSSGGAGRAAFNLHRAMVTRGLDSTFLQAAGARFHAARLMERQLPRLQGSPWVTWRSVGRFASLDARTINASGVDVVNIHWVTDGFLSVEEIGKITLPVVWTMHDMWTLTGTEHYAQEALGKARWREGYTRANRPEDESGLDLDRWTWRRKRDSWSQGINLIPVSNWLREAAEASPLTGTWPHMVVPNVMDIATFSPGSREAARTTLGLPEGPLIAFTTSAGISDERKGWQHLVQALPLVREVFPNVKVMVIGQSHPSDQSRFTDGVLWIGPINDDQKMAALVRSADVIAVPSLLDNLPMTACEAQSSGRSVVAFSVGGLSDTIDHLRTGYLAQRGSIRDFAQGLVRAIEESRGRDTWGRAARERAIRMWSSENVVDQYRIAYERVLS